MSSKKFSVVDLPRREEQEAPPSGPNPNLPKEESWDGKDESKRQKRASDMKARIEESRRLDLDEALKIQSRVTEKLLEASKALVEASNLSEGLQKRIYKNRFYREINLDRRFRIMEIVRTVNTARHQIGRIHQGSTVVGKDVKESADELITIDPKLVFEQE